MSFTQRLEYLINEFGVSHKDIEQNTGVSAGNISHYRTGKSKPGFDVIIALSEFFNVSIDWLLLGREPNKQQETSDIKYKDQLTKEWIQLFESVPKDARPLLVGTVRALVQSSYPAASGNSKKNQLTSPSTEAEDQNAAAAEIA